MHLRITFSDLKMKRKHLHVKWVISSTMMAAMVICISCKQKSKTYKPTYSSSTSETKTLLYGVPTQSYYAINDLFVKYLNDSLKGVRVQTVATSSFLGYM